MYKLIIFQIRLLSVIISSLTQEEQEECVGRVQNVYFRISILFYVGLSIGLDNI